MVQFMQAPYSSKNTSSGIRLPESVLKQLFPRGEEKKKKKQQQLASYSVSGCDTELSGKLTGTWETGRGGVGSYENLIW